MKRSRFGSVLPCFLICLSIARAHALAAAEGEGGVKPSRITTAIGELEGVVSADGRVRAYKGIPFAAPPVGPFRWKAPQPVQPWGGTRKALDYGPRCMQARVYDDMIFRDSGPSEDCLYLNIWIPVTTDKKPLPVMVWIYGGGFVAGSSSEPRQDGENLSKRGVIVVSFNYRLGVFGFFSHPELTRESGREASGNYGLMDQVAALQWVHDNIATFGGDPGNVTIFGESAGSFSVSALMASPRAKGLFQRAIGESGAFFGSTLSLLPLPQTEMRDVEFAKKSLGTDSLTSLRAKPAAEILAAASKQKRIWFSPNIDGYFLPRDVCSIFEAGEESPVPLMAGWNADEGSYDAVLGRHAPTLRNFRTRVRAKFGDNADRLLKVYSAENDAQAKRAAQDLAGDQFIGYSTWKWLEMHRNVALYRYQFDQTLPPDPAVKQKPGSEPEAPHASEIEFVFDMLFSRKLPWRPADRKTSDIMGSYWTNFAKTGDPNGPGLPRWPVYRSSDGYQVMHLSGDPRPVADGHRGRYEFLDSLSPRK